MLVLFTFICGLLCLIWLLSYVHIIGSLQQLPRFSRLQVVEPAVWPRLSVIVPARNESTHLESAVHTLLSQSYPNLEIILVNDRSTDDTGKLADGLASKDSRIHVVHVDKLPERWLGKVNALQHGLKKATGEWILFTDADIHFSPHVLRRAIAWVTSKQIDHLALLPKAKPNGFWLGVAIRTFGLLFLLTTRAAKVNQSDSNAYIGVGAFNLVNAEVFCRTPGFEWLRLEPIDDLGVGLMMKQAGGRAFFALADEDISLQWYSSIPAMFRGLEKNLFGPGPRYRLWRLLFSVVQIWALVMAPIGALVAGIYFNSEFLLIAGMAVYGAHVLFSAIYTYRHDAGFFEFLLFPLGMLMISAMMLRAGTKCLRQNGIDWRGTHYRLDQLRAGQRVKF